MVGTGDSTQTTPRRVRFFNVSPRWMAALGLGLVLAGGASAAGAQGVTLADALKLALRPDNLTLQQQNDTVAGAAGRAQEAKGAFDWTTHVEGGWQQLYVPTPSNGFLTNQTSTVTSYYYNANVGRRFRNGIEIDPGITGYPGAGATPAQTSGLTQLRPALGLKIPVLRGFGTGAADAAERAAGDSLESARENRAFAMQQFTQSVTATYWRCVADDQIVLEAKDADRNAEAYGANLNKMMQKGLIEPTVVQQWSANDVARHLSVDRAQDQASRCRRDLAYAMTGSVSQPWPDATGDLPSVETLAPALDHVSEEALVALALDRREDLKAASGSLLAARENLRSARDSARSELDLHIDPDRAIVSYTKSLGNNAARGRESEAAGAEDQASLALHQLQDQVRNQVSDALVDLKRAASDWAALDGAAKQMDAVVTDAEKRARFGAINWSDYLGAQSQLSQLRQQAIGARQAFAVDLATLRLATGTIETDQPMSLASDLQTLPTP
jgi:outer membrane protein TolC